MKAKLFKVFSFYFMVTMLSALIFVYAPASEKTVLAEEAVTSTSIANVSDGFFTLKSNAVARRGIAENTQRQVETDSGQTITYYCYQWREISSITFSFSASLSGTKYVFTSYSFSVSTIQTENINTSIGQATTSTLISGAIKDNKPSISNLYYYFDSDADTSSSATKFSGNDFGLYKFDFKYTFTEDNSENSEAHTISIGELYIAILPDDIDSISASQIGLTYSVSSSNKLMNVYNISFSNKDTFKYVNPKYIQWTVIGKDKQNADYVLTKQIRDESYITYKYIWEALPSDMQEGNSFILDTKDIEGEWNVYCTIYNSDGSEKAILVAENLSTIKHKEKSYVWLILGIILCASIIALTIGLIVYKYKDNKKI